MVAGTVTVETSVVGISSLVSLVTRAMGAAATVSVTLDSDLTVFTMLDTTA